MGYMIKLYSPRGSHFDTLFFKDKDAAEASASQWRTKDGARYSVTVEPINFQD